MRAGNKLADLRVFREGGEGPLGGAHLPAGGDNRVVTRPSETGRDAEQYLLSQGPGFESQTAHPVFMRVLRSRLLENNAAGICDPRCKNRDLLL